MTSPATPGRQLDLDSPIPATWGLLAVLVVVHAATGAFGVADRLADPSTAWLVERPDRLRIAVGGQFSPVMAAQPWRLATSGLLHVDGLHLLFNGLALYTLGRVAEPLVGAARVLATFCAGVWVGSLVPQVVGVLQSDGASGGAFALLAALAVWGREHGSAFVDEDARLLGPILAGFLVLNLVLSAIIPALDIAGHLGGAAAGALVARLWDESPAPPGWWLAVAVTTGIAAAGWLTLALS